MSKTLKIVLIVGGILVALLIVAVIGFALILESVNNKSVASNSVLVMKLQGSIPEYSQKDPMAELFGVQQQQSLSGIVTNLRKAKVDSRISAVVLDISFTDLGWGKSDELRRAMKDFRKSGKPLYAYTELGMNKEYYIAAAADKIFMPPTGDLYINGFAANAMFYKGSLDKLGIEPEVIQIGKYKNAPDQYTRKEMSEGQRETLNAILDDLYGRMISSIAEDRKLSKEKVTEIVDTAPHRASNAKKLGIIDGAKYRDQMYDEIKKKLSVAEDEELSLVSAKTYSEISPSSLSLNNGSKVAVIYASGGITTGSSSSSPFGGQMLGSDTIVRAVNTAAEDESIKAIVLRVDSPGGSALASDLMWHAIEKAKKEKPVVVSMADYAASGGYYISCNADKIVAEPSVLTGSIGVFMGKPNVKGMYDWLGVSNEYILRGKNAGLFRETESWTEEERAKFQQQANDIYYTDFVPKVAKGRDMSEEKVNSLGQGRVWTGAQAKENGLVDILGGLETAIEEAKKLAKIPADQQVTRVSLPKKPGFFETLANSSGVVSTKSREEQAKEAFANAMPKEMKKLFRRAEMLERMGRGESMLIMPFELEIK